MSEDPLSSSECENNKENIPSDTLPSCSKRPHHILTAADLKNLHSRPSTALLIQPRQSDMFSKLFEGKKDEEGERDA